MSAPQSPIASLLTWLTVFGFLFAAAPSPHSTTGLKEGAQQALPAGQLGELSASFGLPDAHTVSTPTLLKAWHLLGTPAPHPFTLSQLTAGKPLGLRCLAQAPVHRPTLVGVVELRI